MPNNRIAPLRREHGMNQKELGQELGVAQTTVSAWETGKTEPDSAAMGKMAQLFHVSIGYLMGYEPESLTRGLPKAEHDALVKEALTKQRERKLVKEIEAMEQQEEWEAAGCPDEEFLEYERWQEIRAAWESGTPAQTLQGFLAGRLIDEQPAEMRVRLLKMLEAFTEDTNT